MKRRKKMRAKNRRQRHYVKPTRVSAKKFNVGFDGELIGSYHANSSDEAISLCIKHYKDNDLKPPTGNVRDRGWISVPA